MNRRHFLKISLGLAAATAVGPIVREQVKRGYMQSPFVLYGDGYHDDTEALQALINGKPVLFNGRILKAESNTVYLPAGTFNISENFILNEKTALVGAA